MTHTKGPFYGPSTNRFTRRPAAAVMTRRGKRNHGFGRSCLKATTRGGGGSRGFTFYGMGGFRHPLVPGRITLNKPTVSERTLYTLRGGTKVWTIKTKFQWLEKEHVGWCNYGNEWNKRYDRRIRSLFCAHSCLYRIKKYFLECFKPRRRRSGYMVDMCSVCKRLYRYTHNILVCIYKYIIIFNFLIFESPAAMCTVLFRTYTTVNTMHGYKRLRFSNIHIRVYILFGEKKPLHVHILIG